MQLFFASKQAGCDGNLLSLPREVDGADML